MHRRFLLTKTRAQRFPKMEVVGVSLPFPNASFLVDSVACEMQTWPWCELSLPFRFDRMLFRRFVLSRNPARAQSYHDAYRSSWRRIGARPNPSESTPKTTTVYQPIFAGCSWLATHVITPTTPLTGPSVRLLMGGTTFHGPRGRGRMQGTSV